MSERLLMSAVTWADRAL